MNADIERMLHEAQRAKFNERRTEPRHPFVRPVKIHVKDHDPIAGFSKDISRQGVGIVIDQEIQSGTIAVLVIHTTTGRPVSLKCEVRWCDKFGDGWFLAGWKFVSAAPVPR